MSSGPEVEVAAGALGLPRGWRGPALGASVGEPASGTGEAERAGGPVSALHLNCCTPTPRHPHPVWVQLF